MSDDSEDFGPLQANTPNKPRAIVPSQSKPGSSRAAAEAGPSRIANNKTRKKVTPAEEPSDDDEVQEIAPKNSKNHGQAGARGRRKQQKAEVDEQPEVDRVEAYEENDTNETQEIEQPRTNKARAVAKKPPSKVESTTGAAKGKGKEKVKTAPASKAQRITRHEPEPMEVDAIEIPDDEDVMDAEEVEVNEQTNVLHGSKASSNSVSLAQLQSQLRDAHKDKEDAHRQNKRLEKERRQLLKHIEDLQRQLEELHQVRQTEPEQLMERMELHHKAQLAARDDLNRQYADQLAQQEPLFSPDSGFELLTREQVKKETHHLQQKIKEQEQLIHRNEQSLKQKDQELSQKNIEIEELKEDKRLMKIELDAEIAQAKILKDRADHSLQTTQSRQRQGNIISSSSDPKYSTIVSFYEDLTNIIVPNMKSYPGKYLDKDEWLLNCIYVHKDVVNKRTSSGGKTLNFNLRLVWDLKPDKHEPVTDKSQLAESVQYIPLGLDKETPEFREALGFLGDNFTFERDQLSLFVRTLYDYMSGEDNENGDDDDSVQIVE